MTRNTRRSAGSEFPADSVAGYTGALPESGTDAVGGGGGAASRLAGGELHVFASPKPLNELTDDEIDEWAARVHVAMTQADRSS